MRRHNWKPYPRKRDDGTIVENTTKCIHCRAVKYQNGVVHKNSITYLSAPSCINRTN